MTENRRALIVASYQYQDPDLRRLVAPAQDAESLARVLQDPAIGGFQVQTLLNEPSYKVTQAIEAFFTDRKLDDLLLLYFSGHGIKDDWGRLYFATTNTIYKSLRSTAIPASLVNEVLSDSRSRRQVLLLDCCYSGAFARTKSDKTVGIKEQLRGRGRVVLTSSNALQYSFEGDEIAGEGVRSVFTRVLVRGLETGDADRDKDGNVSLDELYEYVYDHVVDETPKQRPQMVATVEGKIIIARNPHWVIKPAELPSELQRAIESSFAGLRAGAVSELESLLHGSDESLTLAARQSLERLIDDDSRRVSGAAARALGTVHASVQTPREAPPPRAPQITPRKTEPTRPQPETAQSKMLSSDRILWKQDGKEMVRVPAGKFLYGDDKEARDLPEFWIDKTPVTNAEYARFVAAAGHGPPKHWKGKTPPKKIADHPVVRVSWHDAVAYAEWAGKRLPIEEEWEKAARGADGRKYPWGNQQPTSKLCNFGMKVGDTTAVGKYSPGGDSPYGCVDMAGNVWEWTASEWKEGSISKVLRGGSFFNDRAGVRAAGRVNGVPDYRYVSLGFRCVGVAPGR